MLRLKELAVVTTVALVAMGWARAFQPAVVERSVQRPVAEVHPAPVPRLVRMARVLLADPRRHPLRPRLIAVRISTQPIPPDTVAVAPLPPQPVAPDSATLAQEAGDVATHVSQKIPADLAPYFDVVIYVSKAAEGPWAQRLFLFHKNADGTLTYEESFPVSTGRERSEKYFTATPTGLFELDVHRFMPMAHSRKWNDAQMPWAMFLDYSYRTTKAGVALHAAIGRRELADIGHRASGGCVRLPIEKANMLFHRFLADERGQVPVLAFDNARGTTNTDGLMVRDANGDVVLADGLRVLVVIDNFPGTSPFSPQS